MEKTKLSVIVVTYNSAEDILECLGSIYREMSDIEVIVTDNNSQDKTVELVRSKFPDVIVISMGNNLGFAAGVNRSISASSGELILLINPDCRILPGALSAMFQTIVFPQTGAVGPILVTENGIVDKNSRRCDLSRKVIFLTILGVISGRSGLTALRKYYYYDQPIDQVMPVQFLSGSCMMVKREVIQRVGGMDAGFFLFGEDIDFSLRIRQRGFRLYYQPRARVIHYAGHSRRSNLPQVIAEEIWSMARLTAKLDWGITSRIVFGLGILLLPLRFFRLRPKRVRQPGAKALKVGEMLKYLYLKIKTLGFPWKNLHQKENVFIKLG